VSWNQPEELTEQMRLSEGLINSEVSLDQHVQLTKEGGYEISSDDWGNLDIPTIFPGGGRSLCRRWCSNSRRTVSCDCQGRRRIGADFRSCPSR
jgi:hypothetical protein